MVFQDSLIFDLLLVGSLIGILVYWYLDRIFNYWARRGAPHVKSNSLIYGNVKDFFYGKIFSATFYDNMYKKFANESYVGYYEFQRPVLMVKDPQTIQTVLIEKFNCFHDSKLQFDKKNDEILGRNPFCQKGNAWKETRSIFVGGMTSNKLKVVEDIVKLVYPDMCKFVDSNPKIEIQDFATRFTSEVVSLYTWGIRSDAFTSDSVIKKAFDTVDFTNERSFVTIQLNPWLAHWMKSRVISKSLTEFIKNVTEQSINNAEKNQNKQTSFVQTLLNTREKLRNNGKDLTIDDFIGQVGTLQIDGYETVARLLGYVLYNLALYPVVQDKMRQDIVNFTEKFTIDSVNKLTYLEMVINEVLRRHPVIPYLSRVCTEKCKLGSLEVETGTGIIIPALSLQNDSKYFPNPEVFNPENFSEENVAKRHKCTFFPFGQGPRTCVGMKLALAEIKLLLCSILQDYEIIPPAGCKLQPIEPGVTSSFLYIPDDPLYIQFKKLKA